MSRAAVGAGGEGGGGEAGGEGRRGDERRGGEERGGVRSDHDLEEIFNTNSLSTLRVSIYT